MLYHRSFHEDLVTVMTGKPIWRVQVSITVLTSMSMLRVPSRWACRFLYNCWSGDYNDLFSQVAPKVVLGSGFVFEIIEVVRQPLSERSN